MRRLCVQNWLLGANFATAGMGMALVEDGKFSISNIMPVLFCAVGVYAYLLEKNAIARRVVFFFLAFNTAAFLSFQVFLFRFEWNPNYFVLFFQDLQLLFCILLIWVAREDPTRFRNVVRAGIFVSLAATGYYGWTDFGQGDAQFSFGMDDKSHAAVLLCSQAYILSRFFGRPLDNIVALGLLILSFLTISRLPVLFVPAIFLALVTRSKYGAVLAAAAGLAGAYVLIAAGDVVAQTFAVYERLSSVEVITGADATSAHVLLLKIALEIKLSDLWTFVLGIGPGNFSNALVSFPVGIGEIEAIDPQLVEFAHKGRAPLHSMLMSIFLDFNIVFFLLFLVLTAQLLRLLLRQGIFADLAFFFALLGASLFYSVHNKPYFFLYTTTIVVLITAQRPGHAIGGDIEGQTRTRFAGRNPQDARPDR